MGGDQKIRPVSLIEAKAQFLEDEPAEPTPAAGIRDWIAAHPKEAAIAAAGVGLALALFPKLRKAATTAAIVGLRFWMM